MSPEIARNLEAQQQDKKSAKILNAPKRPKIDTSAIDRDIADMDTEEGMEQVQRGEEIRNLQAEIAEKEAKGTPEKTLTPLKLKVAEMELLQTDDMKEKLAIQDRIDDLKAKLVI